MVIENCALPVLLMYCYCCHVWLLCCEYAWCGLSHHGVAKSAGNVGVFHGCRNVVGVDSVVTARVQLGCVCSVVARQTTLRSVVARQTTLRWWL